MAYNHDLLVADERYAYILPHSTWTIDGKANERTRLVMTILSRRTIKLALTVVTIVALWLACLQWAAQAQQFSLIEVKPLVVHETKLSGEQIDHQTYQVYVAGYPGAADAAMYAYAEQIFPGRIRDLAEREGKTQVWITFFLERVVVNGQERMNRFRTIFVREGAGWRRLEPPQQKAAPPSPSHENVKP